MERKIGDFGHILGYDVYIGKIGEYEIDFVTINNKGKLYVQVAETLKSIDNKIIVNIIF